MKKQTCYKCEKSITGQGFRVEFCRIPFTTSPTSDDIEDSEFHSDLTEGWGFDFCQECGKGLDDTIVYEYIKRWNEAIEIDKASQSFKDLNPNKEC